MPPRAAVRPPSLRQTAPLAPHPTPPAPTRSSMRELNGIERIQFYRYCQSVAGEACFRGRPRQSSDDIETVHPTVPRPSFAAPKHTLPCRTDPLAITAAAAAARVAPCGPHSPLRAAAARAAAAAARRPPPQPPPQQPPRSRGAAPWTFCRAASRSRGRPPQTGAAACRRCRPSRPTGGGGARARSWRRCSQRWC